ncbi:hypothetical protein LCGC14_1689120 [marine sediment metagenome]|uniref:Uncharacterized protein n=1 Tax=marine sediment metagenome TaxID=412755 RepID=A0A0F9KLG6_9ZZZZ
MKIKPSFTQKEAMALLHSTQAFNGEMESEYPPPAWTLHEIYAYQRACTKLLHAIAAAAKS